MLVRDTSFFIPTMSLSLEHQILININLYKCDFYTLHFNETTSKRHGVYWFFKNSIPTNNYIQDDKLK